MTTIELLVPLLLNYHAKRVNERYRGETELNRRERIEMIARSDIRACQIVKLPGRWTFGGCLALLVTVQEWESGLERGVHAGTKKGPSGESCLAQIHPKVIGETIHNPDYRISEEEYDSMTGLDEAATNRCALAGAKVLMYHVSRCAIPFSADSWWTGARVFAEYHRPSNLCAGEVSPMSSHRGMTFAVLYRKFVLTE